jgi:hypothetical protein
MMFTRFFIFTQDGFPSFQQSAGFFHELVRVSSKCPGPEHPFAASLQVKVKGLEFRSSGPKGSCRKTGRALEQITSIDTRTIISLPISLLAENIKNLDN